MTDVAYEIAGCPACGASRSTTIRDQAQIRTEVEELWQFHLRRRRPGVPIPRLFDRTFFTQPPPLQVVACDACGLLFRNPRERAERLSERYAEEVAGPDILRELHVMQRWHAEVQANRLTGIAGRPGRGLEVGSYVGSFLAAARGSGWQFHGVDVNEAANAFARSLGFQVWQGAIEDVDVATGFDAIAFWNCFDQLPDPKSALAAARRRLQPGGILAIRVPNGAFYRRFSRSPLPRRFTRSALAWNNLLAFPYRHGFSPDVLGRLLHAHDFKVVKWLPDTLVSIADEWTLPWARLEERVMKRLIRPAAPWLEVYAAAVPANRLLVPE